MLNSVWQHPPKTLALTTDAVHVWRADTRSLAHHLDRFAQTLTADEQTRANRYRSDLHRQDFMINRGILRSLLARYLNCSPVELHFTYGTHGKPALTQPTSSLCFNVSHSQGMALYAIALNRPVGIDVEQIRPIDADQIASRFFTPNEYAALCALPPEKRQDAFFRLWTHKEALVKATGEGLHGLKQTDIAFLLNPQATQPNLQNWFLHQIELDSRYKGAIAIQGKPSHINQWLWQVE